MDTRVARVSRRLGFTREVDPVRIERDLNDLVPKGNGILAAHRFIIHGPLVWVARRFRPRSIHQKPYRPVCLLQVG